MTDYDDECTWYPYRVKARVYECGELREQVWMGRDANHALERAADSLMTPFPDEVSAERIYRD
jgi:hypothetical protein